VSSSLGLTTSQNLLLCVLPRLFQSSYLKEESLCAPFVEKECVNIWIGHDVHLVQNTLRDGDEFNWILTHKDSTGIAEPWFQPGDMNEVRRIIATCDPHIAAAVNKTEKCLDWKICYCDPLPTWVSKNHTIALLSDSCHPHLPTSAQGASQATESAAALAECLNLAGRDNVPLATRVYERLRFPRLRQSQTNGEGLWDRWHSALTDVDDGVEIDPEAVKIRNRLLYGFDTELDTRKRWTEVPAIVQEELWKGRITPLC